MVIGFSIKLTHINATVKKNTIPIGYFAKTNDILIGLYRRKCDFSCVHLGWYAQRRCTFTLESNADFGRRAMLLNAENSGIPDCVRCCN